MKEVIYNEEFINDDEIDETVTRVKGLFINSKNEIFLSCCEDVYQFPGGHLKEGETLEEGFKREIKEEIGISLENVDNPFLCIIHRKRNYRNSGKNRQNEIYYYLVKTEENPHLDKTHLDEYEARGNYEVNRVNLKDFKNTLYENKLNKNDYIGLTKEMVRAYEEALELL